MGREKRQRLEIIKDILGIILLNRNIGPTHILYKANLSPLCFKEYTEYLIKKKLINITTTSKKNLNGDLISKESKHYNLTELGRQYLEDYKIVDNFIEKYGIDEE